MRQEITDLELDEVVGGTVVISEDKKKMGFTTSGNKYYYDGEYLTLYLTVKRMYDEKKTTMNDAQFDAYCEEQLLGMKLIHK